MIKLSGENFVISKTSGEILMTSPAKINIYLNVVGLRPDGYHDIVTVFQLIDLKDEVSVVKGGDGISLKVEGSAPQDETNLAWKAAKLFENRLGRPIGVKIRIKKVIPEAQGLGGGSSNAAATLLGLNELLGAGFDKDELGELAKALGADVRFFVEGMRFAIGTARGDELTSIDTQIVLWQLLVVPPYKFSTKEVYSALNLGLTETSPEVKILICALKENNPYDLAGLLYNRLESVAAKKNPEILKIKEFLLAKGALGASLTGSGGCLFALAKNREEAVRLEGEFDRFARDGKLEGWHRFVAKTYNGGD